MFAVASILVTVQPAIAQETPLSTPEFTVTVREDSFDVKITNQHLPNENTPVYFIIRVKTNANMEWEQAYGGYQSKGDYTTISFQLNEKGQARGFGGFIFSGNRVFFQVMRSTYTASGREVAPPNNWIFTGSNSSWSGTQAISFPALPTQISTTYTSKSSPESENTEPPSQPTYDANHLKTEVNLDLGQLVTMALLSVIILLLLIVIGYLRKRSVEH